jgi:hypothetical protein
MTGIPADAAAVVIPTCTIPTSSAVRVDCVPPARCCATVRWLGRTPGIAATTPPPRITVATSAGSIAATVARVLLAIAKASAPISAGTTRTRTHAVPVGFVGKGILDVELFVFEVLEYVWIAVPDTCQSELRTYSLKAEWYIWY